MPTIENYRGIIPAIACPFTPGFKIDEPALRKHASWLATQPGVVAVMTNGHTGEVFSLTPRERAEVTRIVADELRGKLPVISSIVCEGVPRPRSMPRWPRKPAPRRSTSCRRTTGCASASVRATCVDYFEAIAEAGLDLVAHVYPVMDPRLVLVGHARPAREAALRAGVQGGPARHEQVRRGHQGHSRRQRVEGHPDLPRRVPARARWCRASTARSSASRRSFPSLINDLWQAVQAGDLKRAMKIQDVITPLKDAVYGGGEPTGEAHARMKMGMYLAGVLDAPTVRPPTEAPREQEMAALRNAVAKPDFSKR